MGIVYLLLFILMNICRYISNAHFSKPCLGICSEIQACKNWVNLNPNLSELWGTQVLKIDKPNKSKKANTASNGGGKNCAHVNLQNCIGCTWAFRPSRTKPHTLNNKNTALAHFSGFYLKWENPVTKSRGQTLPINSVLIRIVMYCGIILCAHWCSCFLFTPLLSVKAVSSH